MIEPFLLYWVPQVFWLGFFWLGLFLFFRLMVMPKMIVLRKSRKRALTKKNATAENLEKTITTLKNTINTKNKRVTKKARNIVESARAENDGKLRAATQVSMDTLRKASQEHEERFNAATTQLDVVIAKTKEEEVAKGFIDQVMKDL